MQNRKLAASRAHALTGLRDHAGFRDSFVRVLAASRFEAFSFETPPWTAGTLQKPFEWVLVDAPQVASQRPDPSAFDAPLSSSNDSVVCFAAWE